MMCHGQIGGSRTIGRGGEHCNSFFARADNTAVGYDAHLIVSVLFQTCQLVIVGGHACRRPLFIILAFVTHFPSIGFTRRPSHHGTGGGDIVYIHFGGSSTMDIAANITQIINLHIGQIACKGSRCATRMLGIGSIAIRTSVQTRVTGTCIIIVETLPVASSSGDHHHKILFSIIIIRIVHYVGFPTGCTAHSSVIALIHKGQVFHRQPGCIVSVVVHCCGAKVYFQGTIIMGICTGHIPRERIDVSTRSKIRGRINHLHPRIAI